MGVFYWLVGWFGSNQGQYLLGLDSLFQGFKNAVLGSAQDTLALKNFIFAKMWLFFFRLTQVLAQRCSSHLLSENITAEWVELKENQIWSFHVNKVFAVQSFQVLTKLTSFLFSYVSFHHATSCLPS